MKRCLFLALLISFSAIGQDKPLISTDTTGISKLISQSRKSQWTDSYQSLNYADQALANAQGIRFLKGIAAAENLRGFCYWTFGDNDQAIQSALEALQIAQTERFPLIEAESHYILARSYMDLGENDKARVSIEKAESLAKNGKDWEQICSIYNLKGVIFFIDRKLDSALFFYNLAFKTGMDHAVDSVNFPRIISNIGECYADENPKLALHYFTDALGLARRTGNTIAEASILSIVGHAFLRGKDYRNAETNLQAALKLAQTLGLRRVIRHAYAGLVDIRLQQGRGNEAVIYLRQYYAVRDSLLNTSKMRQIVELEARHELQLKEQNIKLLESEARIQSIRANLMFGLIVLVIIASVGLYLLQRYRYRKNRKLLDLEIDYLTRQHKESVDRFKAMVTPEPEESIESYDQKLLKKAIEIVEANLADPRLSVEKMADELNMSRTSLHRKIKSITGFPPSELIRSIRLRKAARLIANRADTASQVALMVGFEDYSHFSKAFKKYFGVSPSGYEEQSNALQES